MLLSASLPLGLLKVEVELEPVVPHVENLEESSVVAFGCVGVSIGAVGVSGLAGMLGAWSLLCWVVDIVRDSFKVLKVLGRNGFVDWFRLVECCGRVKCLSVVDEKRSRKEEGGEIIVEEMRAGKVSESHNFHGGIMNGKLQWCSLAMNHSIFRDEWSSAETFKKTMNNYGKRAWHTRHTNIPDT